MHDPGKYIVRCNQEGGDTLALYSFAATEGQEVDLLASGTPASLRAADYATADNMCRDVGFELAAKIASGAWSVVLRQESSDLGGA